MGSVWPQYDMVKALWLLEQAGEASILQTFKLCSDTVIPKKRFSKRLQHPVAKHSFQAQKHQQLNQSMAQALREQINWLPLQ